MEDAPQIVARLYVSVKELDDVFGGSSRQENFGDTLLLKLGQILLRDDAADQDQAVVHPFSRSN
jgi:hypothetical protein